MIIDPPAPSERLFNAAEIIDKPSFLIDGERLEQNGEILHQIASASGCKIVFAQKAFAQPQLYPLIGKFLHGACASGSWEAQLARDYLPLNAEVITCAPAYDFDDIKVLLPISDHLDFNSITQWHQFREQCLKYQQESGGVNFGLRINPEHSTGETALYDPCAYGSRLGATREQISKSDLVGISGLHFHTLCEQGLQDLLDTVKVVEDKFGDILSKPQITYLNLGGGHWITKDGYDRDGLVSLILRLQKKYNLTIYLEPGEALAIHSGLLVAKVLDIHQNGSVINAILNVSATAHMPDVLEMPYRPDVFCDRKKVTGTGSYQYRLTGNTCLAGDQIGDYSFPRPLKIGEQLIFNDMAHYTMVKTTFFNGVQHPQIYYLPSGCDTPQLLKGFSYNDFLRLKK